MLAENLEIEMPIDMTQELLDKRLLTDEPRLSIESTDPSVVKRVASLLSKLELHSLTPGTRSLDLRYRLRFMDRREMLLEIYIDPFGPIVYKGAPMEVLSKAWQQALWAALVKGDRYLPTRQRRPAPKKD